MLNALILLLGACTGASAPATGPAPDVDRGACEVPCRSLGPQFVGGRTTCDAAGAPDTSACRTVAAPEIAEVVKPAMRDGKQWATARCNDGTPFGYLLRRTESKTWVIVLEGGSFCDDGKLPCAGRRPKLLATLPWEDGERAGMQDEGVLSRDAALNPHFHDANMVGAQYCTSDLWTGESAERRPVLVDPQGWYFSGRHNVRAMLGMLATQGLDDSDPGTRVLVVGHSAGGTGVVANLDQLQGALPRTAGAGRLKVVLDGSWIPVQPSDAGLPDADRYGKLHPACHDALAAKGEDPARCAYGPVWWPHVAKSGIPVLVQIAGMDATQAGIFDIAPAAQPEYMQRTRASLDGVPWVFSGARKYHTLALDPGFDVGPPGGSFRDLLGRFWEGGPPERVLHEYDRPAEPTPKKAGKSKRP